MAIDLDKRAENVDLGAAEYGPMLESLQANILTRHGRDFERHIFLRFTATPPDVKKWIREIVAPNVTTAAQQLAQRANRRADKRDGGTVGGFFLSAAGYRFLGHDTNRFASKTFRKGMKNQDDFITQNRDPKPDTWEAGFQEEIHALITVGDDNKDIANTAVTRIGQSCDAIGKVLVIEEGLVLRRTNAAKDKEPVEHFGYFDGISNPLFTKQDLANERPENNGRRSWNAGASLSLVLADDPFTDQPQTFGSYLVYRKLGQDYGVFKKGVEALAQAINTNTELAGAMVVGRFEDGTPVVAANVASAGPDVLNDFDYERDDDGFRCPAHAHIRKVNPRGTTPLTSLESERLRRIVRRGIPYGKPMPTVADDTETDSNPAAARGLLFMCFQQNVEDQFEFIQRTWVDNKRFPNVFGITGDDPLIGQDGNERQRWPEKWGDKKADTKSFSLESAVTLKGGEYFFAPSIPFLRS